MLSKCYFYLIRLLSGCYYYSILKVVNLFSGTHFFKLKSLLLKLINVKVGKESKVVGPIKINKGSKVEIGSHCWIGTNFTIHGNGNVTIANNCDIAPDVTILTGSHEIDILGNRKAGKGITFNYIVGEGTWIGSKVLLVNGVEIGKQVVIGAGSVIVKDCEDNSLYVGVPGKKIKEFC